MVIESTKDEFIAMIRQLVTWYANNDSKAAENEFAKSMRVLLDVTILVEKPKGEKK